jgi:hypothetical protein
LPNDIITRKGFIARTQLRFLNIVRDDNEMK